MKKNLVFVTVLLVLHGLQLKAQQHEKGFTTLFNGSSLDQWEGNTTDYVIEDGVLSLHPENKGSGNLYTKK